MVVEPLLVNTRRAQCISRCAVGILRLFGHIYSLSTAQLLLQFGNFKLCGECRAKAHLLTLGIEDDARLALPKSLLHLLHCRSKARVYTHTRNNYSLHFYLYLAVQNFK